MTGVSEHRIKPRLLLHGEERLTRPEGPPDRIQRVTAAAPMSKGLLLHSLPGAIERVTGELDDMERVHHFDCVREMLLRGRLEPGESVHRDDLDPVPPCLCSLC